MQDFEEEPLITLANHLFRLLGLRAPLLDDARNQLQEEVFQSKWFSLEYFEKTYASIFAGLCTAVFLDRDNFQLSAGQKTKVRKAIKLSKNLSQPVSLELRVRDLKFWHSHSSHLQELPRRYLFDRFRVRCRGYDPHQMSS